MESAEMQEEVKQLNHNIRSHITVFNSALVFCHMATLLLLPITLNISNLLFTMNTPGVEDEDDGVAAFTNSASRREETRRAVPDVRGGGAVDDDDDDEGDED